MLKSNSNMYGSTAENIYMYMYVHDVLVAIDTTIPIVRIHVVFYRYSKAYQYKQSKIFFVRLLGGERSREAGGHDGFGIITRLSFFA